MKVDEVLQWKIDLLKFLLKDIPKVNGKYFFMGRGCTKSRMAYEQVKNSLQNCKQFNSELNGEKPC